MSTKVVAKKRKSADGSTAASKKIKIAKSSEKLAPLKSALKKPRTETSEAVSISKPLDGKKVVSKSTETIPASGKITEQTQKTVIEEEDDGTPERTPDQTAALLAGFSSSEDEAESGDEAGRPISSLPKAPTTGIIQKRIKQAISAAPNGTTPASGVIYIGRIPHGFYEPQMKAYFSQFGEILNLRLGRNKKTGASQHFAFVEFANAEVAEIVAKTMDKYLLFGHILQVRRVPREQVSEGLFRKRGRVGKKPAPRNRLEGRKLRLGATRDVWEKRVEAENARRKDKEEKLRALGYEFDMPVVKAVTEVPVKTIDAGGAADGVDAEGAVKLLEDKEAASADVVETVQNVQPEPSQQVVVEQTITKKRPASGKAQIKKSVKRVKT